MPINRARVRELKESAPPPRPPASAVSTATAERSPRPSALVKHMRQARNLVYRLRAGEDVEETWRKLNRNLRYLQRSKFLVLKEIAPYRTKCRDEEAADIACDLLAELETDRETATLLGYPADAPLVMADGYGFSVVVRDGRFVAIAGSREIGEFTTDDEAYLAGLEASAAQMAAVGRPASRNQFTRWTKLVVTLMDWD